MEIDIIKEARNVFDIEIAELEKLKSKLGDTFQKLVQMILELKNNNKVIITGITKDKPRLDLAKEIGIDLTVDSLVEDLREVILKETDGYGVDKILDCSGSVYAVNNALPLIKKKGDFVQIGLFSKKMNELDQESIIQREIRYIGSRSQKPSSWVLALDLLANNKIATDKMITKIFSLENTRNAFEAVMSGKEIKVLIKSNEDIE